MRVITGTARGRKLIAPEGLDVRPTKDSVKEAIFSAIQFETEGSVVLDLFSGCQFFFCAVTAARGTAGRCRSLLPPAAAVPAPHRSSGRSPHRSWALCR